MKMSQTKKTLNSSATAKPLSPSRLTRLQSPTVELTLQRCTAPKHMPGNCAQSPGSHLDPSTPFVFYLCFDYTKSRFPSSRNGCPTLETMGPGVISEDQPGKAK